MATRITNIQWLNANAGRNYPLDDCASKVDVDGTPLPDDIITDLHLWFPGDPVSDQAAISSVTVSDKVVSVTFVYAGSVGRPCDTGGNDLTFLPLGAISVTKPVVVGRNYEITGFADGVSGWICFGSGANDRKGLNVRFDDSTQAPILPRLGVAYRDTDRLDSVGKAGSAAALTGVVKLLSGNANDLRIQGAWRIIDPSYSGSGVCTRVITLGLNQEQGGATVFSRYLGPCDGQPQALSCQNPPIFTIDGVSPDCNGNINIVFSAPSSAIPVNTSYVNSSSLIGGIILDYGMGIAGACKPMDPGLTTDGNNKCDPEPCTGFSSSSSSLSSSSGDSSSSLSPGCSDPPFTDTFSSMTCWYGYTGTWALSSGQLANTSAVDLAVITRLGTTTVFTLPDLTPDISSSAEPAVTTRTISSDLGIVATPTHSLGSSSSEAINSDVARVYVVFGFVNPINFYFAAIDYHRQSVSIGRVANGATYFDLETLQTVAIGTLYHVVITVDATRHVTAVFSGGALSATLGPISIQTLPQGLLGLGSGGVTAVFDNFAVS